MPEQAPPVRAFIAVELPDAVKQGLEQLQQRLSVEPANGIKWVSPQGIHLTLKFLGWIAADRVDSIKSALAEVVKGFEPFEVGITGLGAFPNLRRINVVWCGLTGDLVRLEELQQSVEKHVSPLGYPTENRAFSPHLTLSRLRDDVSPAARQMLAAKISETKYQPGLAIPVDSLSLMQSTLLPTGAVYTCLGCFRLAEVRCLDQPKLGNSTDVPSHPERQIIT
jgi:2'-5' RNA ligase